MYSLSPYTPYILDTVFPLENKTRPLWIPFYADYIFFDQIRYHYLVNIYAAFVYAATCLLTLGIDGTFVIAVKHVSGLFAVTW